MCYWFIDNDMRYPELHKKHIDADGNIVWHKLPKDGVIRAAWINVILKGRTQVIHEKVYRFVTAYLLG